MEIKWKNRRREEQFDAYVVKALRSCGVPCEAIPRFYEAGILEHGRPFRGCKMWGISLDMLTLRQSDIVTAIHESGHAVIGILGGGRFKKVTIVARAHTAGGVVDFTPTGQHNDLLHLAAGPISDSIATTHNHARWDFGAFGDFFSLFLNGRDLDMSGVIEESADIVKGHWREIQLLAEELVVKRELTFDQCLPIVKR